MMSGAVSPEGSDVGLSPWPIFGVAVVTFGLVVVYVTSTMVWAVIGTSAPRGVFQIVLPFLVLPLLAFIEAMLAQVLSYVVLVVSAILLLRRRGFVPLWPLLLSSPLLGLLMWFGYEHFVPDSRFMLDLRAPYEYGLTLQRFLLGWGIQILVVIGYWWPMRRRNSAEMTA
jgi:hypothetical protein